MTRLRPVGWGIESTCYNNLNVVSCEIVTELTRNQLVGAYPPPLRSEHLPVIDAALQRFRYPILLGDLNVDLEKARS